MPENPDQLAPYDLKRPITVGGKIITRLTFVPPIGKRLKLMDKVQGEISKSLMLIAACNEQLLTPEDCDLLHLVDIRAIGEILGGDLSRG
ncbi:MAG: phage tail assembly protein [Verrucomicrobiota bacterium]|nr:phage tail assembly protein [Verrucomicrobiota bacterium]